GLAIGIAIVYALEIVLLVLLVWLMLEASSPQAGGASAEAGILQFFIILYLLALLTGDPSLGALWIWIAGFVMLMLLPVAIAVMFSLWAATRPREPVAPPGSP